VTKHAIVLAPAGEPGPLARVGGLSLVKRAILVLGRAGIEHISVVTADPAVRAAIERDDDPARAGIAVTVVTEAPVAAEPAVIVPASRVFDVAVAKAVVSGEVADLFAVPADRGINVLVDSPAAARRAEDALFDGLRKRVDGVISRHINRPISMYVTRHLIRTPITPNQMTVIANVIGLAGVLLVFQATWWTLAAGALLVNLQSVLDGCDGELARLELKSSRFGEWFDNVTDDHVNMAYGVGLGYAATELTGQGWWLAIGIGSAIAYAFHNAVMYYQLARVHHTGSPFAFRWWFEGDEDVTAMMTRPGLATRIVAALRAGVRRDVFLFAFMLLAFARLPHVAMSWYGLVAASQSTFMAIHLARGGVSRARGRRVPS
jgi:phosphatidylglycerophosphate synthase